MTPWSSGNSPTICVTRSALQRRAARLGGGGGAFSPPGPGGGAARGGGGGLGPSREGGGGRAGGGGGGPESEPAERWAPSTGFAGPPPRSGEELGTIPSSTSHLASLATRSTLSATVPSLSWKTIWLSLF